MMSRDGITGGPSSSNPVKQRSNAEKLKRRLSNHAFKIADATQTGIQEEDLYNTRLGQLWVKYFGRNDLMKIVLPIFIEDAFKGRARRWAFLYFTAMALSSILQVTSTNISLQLTTTLEFMDGESFYHFLLLWLLCTVASILRNAVQVQARWELRMMVQWRLQFRMGHALFSSDAFHHMQVGLLKVDHSQDVPNPAPESLLCRDSYLWLAEFSVSVDAIIMQTISLVTSIYTVSNWSYKVLIYMLMTVPFRAWLNIHYMPTPLWYMHRIQIATNWDLMFVMGRIQDNAEQIALLRGGQAELRRFSSVLKVLLKNNLTITFWTYLHQTFTMICSTVFMLPLLVKLLYEVCDHGLSVSAAMTYSGQSVMVQAHMATLANASHLFLRYQQTVQNMQELIKEGHRINNEAKKRAELGEAEATIPHNVLVTQKGMLETEGPELELRNVTLAIPNPEGGWRWLLFGFSLQLMPGESMLVVGDTGVGKSLLLRAIHGLWFAGTGNVKRCHNSLLSCMPERPFTFAGTLRQNLIYPEVEEDEVTDQQIYEILEALNLTALKQVGLDQKAPWFSILSLGQQQRLGFARILLRPNVRMVLLDEATSALDMRNERNIYRMLRDRFPCYISVGHRPSVREYHTHVSALRFNSDRSVSTSSAEFVPIGDFDFGQLDKLKEKGRAETQEEKLWAKRAAEIAAAQGTTQEATLPNKEEKEQQETVGKPPQLISLERSWGGFSLLVRALRDVIWPMITQPEVIGPIFTVFGVSYAFSYCNLAMEMWFGYPYAQVINVMQTRNSRLCWSFFFRTMCLYYPVQVVFLTISRTLVSLQGVICRITIKWFLAKCYLDPKHDAFYQMSVCRVVEGNPGTRISTWDADTANVYITSLVATLSTAVFGVWISCRSLYGMNQTAFYYFVVYIVVGATFYSSAGLQVFRAYIKWLDLTMQLHHSVLHIRHHSEAIALLMGSDYERRHAFVEMDKAITPGAKYLWRKDAAQCLGGVYFGDVSDVALTLITGPMVLTGDTTYFGQSQMKGIIAAGSFGVQSMMIEMLLNVEGQAAMERVWELLAVILHIKGAEQGKSRFGGDIMMEEDADMQIPLELRSVSLRTPVSASGVSGTGLLVKDVNLKIEYGDSLLIAGESGIGKSSVLRAVAGLWRHGEGMIRVSDDTKSFFIPQRPYIFIGTLRENLLYPDTQRVDIDDNTLTYVCEMVGLSHLLIAPGLGEYRNEIEVRQDVNSEVDKGWFWRLSLGELQRMNFARLLLKEDIRLVFLDEATSALSIDKEEAMYHMLKKTVGSYISVAHRPQLRRFHQRAFVMLTDHTKPLDAVCRTKCLLMGMEEYERVLNIKADEGTKQT